jgi:hypothetical protein
MTTFSLQCRTRVCFSALAFVCVSASVAVAQSDPAATLAFRGPYYQPVSPIPVEMGFTQHHSSTVIEGAQRGRAAVIQALGNYQLSESQAEVIREEARALDRENCLKRTQALHAQKEMWNKARIQDNEQREARIANGQKKIAELRATVYRHAYQLSSLEFDATTGAIAWPTVLQDSKYQQLRDRIEELFRIQAGYGDPNPRTVKEIARNVEAMKRALRSDVSNLPKDEFLGASKFLAGLGLEAESFATAA